jgi:hypothetical protein
LNNLNKYPYPNGLKDDNGDWIHRPVHSFLFGLWVMRCSFKEIHHGYEGMLLSMIGYILTLSINNLLVLIGWILIILGAYLFYDDFIKQHPRQVYQYKPLYHSPVHIWYGKHLYTNTFVRWLNIQVDKLIKKIWS